MKIAVVTPYHREKDDVLQKCLLSVRDQEYKGCHHFIVADGFPNPIVNNFAASHIILPSAHGDNGNAARCLGAITAVAEGYDAISFLDADNWYRPDHIMRLVELHEKTTASVCTSARTMHRIDGSFLAVDYIVNDGKNFADTSCICFFRPAFHLLPLWAFMPRRFGPICDRIMWLAIKSRQLSTSHSIEPTVAFRTQYAWDYTSRGEAPPPGAKAPDELKPLIDEFNHLPEAEKIFLLTGVPPTLRLKPPP